MSLVLLEGFDTNDLAQKWAGTATLLTEVATSLPWGAGMKLNIATGSTGARVSRSFPASAHVFVGCMVQSASQSGGQAAIFQIGGDGGATGHIAVTLQTGTGALNVYRVAWSTDTINTTLLCSSATNALPLSTWGYVELEATCSDTVGIINLRVNGAIVASFTGDTRNGGTSTNFDTISLASYATNHGSNIWLDDLYICNDQGSVNNSFLGQMRVQTLRPNAAGADSGLTIVGSANHYANVSDGVSTTYNFSSVAGTRDTYNIPDLAAVTAQVYGTSLVIQAANSDTGAGGLKPVYHSGVTNFYDTTDTLGATILAYAGAVRETDPNTSAAWTVSGVNALQIGAEVA